MRPALDGSLVFEGALEARVAGQLLTDAGRPDLVALAEPPIDNPTIGRLGFVRLQTDELKGHGDTTEHTIPSTHREEAVATLALAAKVTSPDRLALSRRSLMGQRLLEYLALVDAVEHPPADARGLVVVGMQVIPTPES